uniref:hypothetical protein n=1 Tax=Flavobacterium sp. TaxID=239 RepID=UPI004049DD83
MLITSEASASLLGMMPCRLPKMFFAIDSICASYQVRGIIPHKRAAAIAFDDQQYALAKSDYRFKFLIQLRFTILSFFRFFNEKEEEDFFKKK